jgi:hypothetical protein
MNDMELTRKEEQRRALVREVRERWEANGNDMGRIVHEHVTVLLRLRGLEEGLAAIGEDLAS